MCSQEAESCCGLSAGLSNWSKSASSGELRPTGSVGKSSVLSATSSLLLEASKSRSRAAKPLSSNAELDLRSEKAGALKAWIDPVDHAPPIETLAFHSAKF